MATEGEILGFSNRWYPLALDTAQHQGLPSGRSIRIVTAPVVLATKLEDLMAVVDGRAALLEECRLSPPELRNGLATQFQELLNTSAFLEALPAFLPPDQASQQRLQDLLETLRAITALAEP